MGRPLKDYFVLLSNIEGSLTAYNINGVETDLAGSYILDYYTNNIENTDVGKNQNPWLYWRGYGYIHQLDSLQLTDTQLQKISQKGLDIYFNELSLFYDTYSQPNPPLDSDTNQTYIQREYNHCVFEFDKLTKLRSYDLDSVEKFANRYNISEVRVHTCHYGAEEYFKEQYPRLEFSSYNTCLQSLVLYINRLYPNDAQNTQILKTFITPLWRYNSIRHLLAAVMVNKDSYLSWYYLGSTDIMSRNLWFDLKKLNSDLYDRAVQGSSLLNKIYSIDPVVPNEVTILDGTQDLWKYPKGYDGYYIENTLNNYYKTSFCAIVSESIFAQPFPTISEKIMIAMKCRRPFVVLGGPNTLKYLKHLGFKTFDQWWDESYDYEQCHYKRFEKIINTVDNIEHLNKELVLKQMEDVLNHNYKLVSSVETFSI